jgi:anaphase-promoting complex subunit 6
VVNFKKLKAVVKLEASMCYVRGQAHMKLGDTAKAKACFKEALIVDVKCYNVSNRPLMIRLCSYVDYDICYCFKALDALLSYNMFEEHLGKYMVALIPLHMHQALTKHGIIIEWDFIYGLPYQDQCGDDADLFRSLYIIKLKKVSGLC